MPYAIGHAKRNAVTGEIALRTIFDDVPQLAHLAWLVGTTAAGPRNTSTAEVDSWDDLYTPPAE